MVLPFSTTAAASEAARLAFSANATDLACRMAAASVLCSAIVSVASARRAKHFSYTSVPGSQFRTGQATTSPESSVVMHPTLHSLGMTPAAPDSAAFWAGTENANNGVQRRPGVQSNWRQPTGNGSALTSLSISGRGGGAFFGSNHGSCVLRFNRALQASRGQVM